MEQTAQEYLYDAFISYSRKDEKFARRLESELERYKLPKGLDHHKRKLNIFRDVQDLVGNELSEAIKTGLRNSRHLIVICSPHSRRSQWVSKEIIEFIDDHGREKVLPVLVSGKPNSEARSEMEDAEKAFPDILYQHFKEPLAADFRESPGLTLAEKRTKWREAKFQVLAFLFEKEKEELLRRQRIRTVKILSSFVILFLFLAIVFGWIAWIADRNATVARIQRDDAIARGLAARAELLIDQQGTLLETAALLAVEAMRRSPSLEVDRAIRKALFLLPKRVADMDAAIRGEIREAAFSPNGLYLATQSDDSLVQVWECATGHEVSCFTAGKVRKFIFYPKQPLLITLAGTNNVWNYLKGSHLIQLPKDIWDASICSGGYYLAMTDIVKKTRIWDAITYQEIISYPNAETMQFVAIAPNAAELVVWNQNIAEIFNSAGAPTQTMELQAATRFEYSPDGKRLSQVSSIYFTSAVYEVATREQLTFDDKHWNATFSGNGRYYALASPEWIAYSYDLQSGWIGGHYMDYSAETGTFIRKDLHRRVSCQRSNTVRHDDSVIDVSLSYYGKYMGTTSRDKTARVWERYSGREVLRLLEEAEGIIRELAFHQNERFVTGWGPKTCRTWETTGHRQVVALEHDDAVFDISFNSNGTQAATISRDGTCRIWKLPQGEEISRIELRGGGSRHSVDFRPDGTQLCIDGRHIWDIATGKKIGNGIESDSILMQTISENWQICACMTRDSAITIKDFESGKELAKRPPDSSRIKLIDLSPNGNWLGAVLGDSGIVLWNWKTAETITEIASNIKIRDFVFDSTGMYIAVLHETDKGIVDVWKINRKSRIIRFAHESEITSATFHPFSTYLLTTNKDRSARIWQISNGIQIAQFNHDADVVMARFSPDGKYVLSAGGRSDRAARLWLWQPDDLIKEVCSRVSRNLTEAEWRQYIGTEDYRKTCPCETEEK